MGFKREKRMADSRGREGVVKVKWLERSRPGQSTQRLSGMKEEWVLSRLTWNKKNEGGEGGGCAKKQKDDGWCWWNAAGYKKEDDARKDKKTFEKSNKTSKAAKNCINQARNDADLIRTS